LVYLQRPNYLSLTIKPRPIRIILISPIQMPYRSLNSILAQLKNFYLQLILRLNCRL